MIEMGIYIDIDGLMVRLTNTKDEFGEHGTLANNQGRCPQWKGGCAAAKVRFKIRYLNLSAYCSETNNSVCVFVCFRAGLESN